MIVEPKRAGYRCRPGRWVQLAYGLTDDWTASGRYWLLVATRRLAAEAATPHQLLRWLETVLGPGA